MPARVLIVDDIPTNLKLLEAKLVREYYEVSSADSGEDALAKARSLVPDIVLLDVMMPGMDGFEVCRKLRADAQTAHIPVVMVTALSDTEDRVKGIEAGADDFLTKPLNDIALFARLRSLVRLKQTMDELRLRNDTNMQLGPLTERLPDEVAQISGASILLIDDSGLRGKKVQTAAADCGYDVQLVEDAQEAVGTALASAFDLIIVNLNIRSGDALRLCSQLRSHDVTRHTPILLIIEGDDIERMAKGLELGVSDYVAAPLDAQELKARMTAQIKRKRYQDYLRDNYRQSLSLALTDDLTGLYNRRYLEAHFQSQVSHAGETGKALSVLMIDIDHFKSFNDTYGHAAGDAVLREVAERLSSSLRNIDMVARYGGEEFVAVLPNANQSIAENIAERLRLGVGEIPVVVSSTEEKAVTVTISIGLAVRETDEQGPELLKRADDALYKAKQRGRNRVATSEPAAQALAM